MSRLKLLLELIFLLLTLHLFQVAYCKRKWDGKGLKKLTKSEVQVKTYLFPCSIDKDIFNFTFGPSHHHLHNCKRKFVIKLSVNSGGEFSSKTDGFIPIDHVIDGVSGRKKRLLNPFMVRLKREKMYQLYDLQLVKSVNAEAKEEVINYENTVNYTGCDTSSSHPTCGFSFFNNKIIQFSEGFCCSCDQNKNDQRQPCESHLHENKEFLDMEYAVHRHRSNRTSRGLETVQHKSGTLDSGSGMKQTFDNTAASGMSLLLHKPDRTIYDSNNIDLKLPPNQCNSLNGHDELLVHPNMDFQPPLKDELSKENITLKTVKMKHYSNINTKDLDSVTPLNIAIDSENKDSEKFEIPSHIIDTTKPNEKMELPTVIKLEDSTYDELDFFGRDSNEYFYTLEHPRTTNNTIDKEKLKLLMIKRIRDDKNKDILMFQDSFLNKTDQSKNKIPRNVPSERDGLSFKKQDYGKQVLSLNIENDNNELRLQIITKKPKLSTIGKGIQAQNNKTPVTKNVFMNNCIDDIEHENNVTEPTTKESLRERVIKNSIIKSFTSCKNKSSTLNKIETFVFPQTERYYSTTTKCIPVTPITSSNKSRKLLPLNNKTNLNINNFDDNTNNATNVKSFLSKLVPVMNTLNKLKATGGESSTKVNGVLRDPDNTTYNIYFELNKELDEFKQMNSDDADLTKKYSTNFENKSYLVGQQDGLPPSVSSSELVYSNLENGIEKEPLGSNSQLENEMHIYNKKNILKREAVCETQSRGGQTCLREGKELPCNANPETYFESAHCLRFSDLWFNVFKLLNARMENSITVKMYAKHKTSDKRVCWENLSKRLPGRVGTINEVLADDQRTIMISYSSYDKVAFNLDCSTDYILVPQPLPRLCKDTELKLLSYGGPEEYLVLKENEITFDGEECDKAGVNYAAFARQLHRCQQEAGSCLHNQPLHYWRKDKEAAKVGKQGHYFLKNFIEVTDQAILQNTTSTQVVLRAPYIERYRSQVVIEMNADHIDIIGDKSEGQITEVYTDATSEKVTIVKAVVTNLGITSDFFGVDFSNCTSRLGPSDFDKPGKDEIPPQHRITYTAMISSPLKSKRVECKMVLYNLDHELVASRHIIIVQGQRCMCVWHCQCVCYNHPDPGLPCNPISVKDYNNAGFPGHLPVTIGSDCSTLFTVLHALLWFFLFLLLFGIIKAVLGLCFSSVALWGLWYLLPAEAKSLQVYQEPQLACCTLVRDCDGFPIHPYSYKRTGVHFLPWYSEFIVNVFFFICVFRSCLCDHGSYRGTAAFYYQDAGYKRPRRNRRFRMSAGAEKEFLNPDPQLLKDEEWAKHLVAELTRAYVVFRVLTRPMGGVKSLPGIPYCIRGFFLESDNGVYEFTPPSPLMQIWMMDGTPLDPPLRLDPSPFHALYHSPQEILAARELSPWARGVVINAP